MRTKKMKDPFYNLGNILTEYGKRGDKTKTIRQLNIQAINYKRLEQTNASKIFKLMKKEINKRR